MVKKEKYFYIDNIHGLDLNYIKKTKAKLIIRDKKIKKLSEYLNLIKKCKSHNISVYVANNVKLLFKLKLNNFYISSSNKKKYLSLIKIKKNISIIGSAHNYKEIREKIEQGCTIIVLSRLFKSKKIGYLDIFKFNFLTLNNKISFIALGGINENNYNKLNIVNCYGVAMMSALFNKPRFLTR
ncbi:thiamine phosphate synthase [Pelagibacteraceae bacterium]|nr:thiamine phosphate synthase [Pelagibacteraceae bacterium]|tara:strand:- start:8909 stop:9457 length:549 start_codon:yes stop_codon:yes gene_type:complete